MEIGVCMYICLLGETGVSLWVRLFSDVYGTYKFVQLLLCPRENSVMGLCVHVSLR